MRSMLGSSNHLIQSDGSEVKSRIVPPRVPSVRLERRDQALISEVICSLLSEEFKVLSGPNTVRNKDRSASAFVAKHVL